MQRPQGLRNRLGPTAPTPRRKRQLHWRRPKLRPNQERWLAPAPVLELEHGPGPGLEQQLALEMEPEPEPEPESLAVQEQV